MITIQNETLSVQINPLGAELTSIKDQATGYEFLWQANPQYWRRHSPVLFPLVGRLKEDAFHYQGQTYALPKHGFARDNVFTVQNVTDTTASFYLKSSPETLAVFPFEFSFQINYVLFENQITVSYEVLNPSHTDTLWYNLGAHPGFNVTIGQDDFDGVTMELLPHGHYLHLPLNRKGFLRYHKAKYLPLKTQIVYHQDYRLDAIIFQLGRDTVLHLHDEKKGVDISMRPTDMPWIAVWTPYPQLSPFICLEPWAGLPDEDKATGEWTEKMGINQAQPNELKTHSFTLNLTKHV